MGFPLALLDPGAWPTFVFVTARLTGLMLTAPLWSMTAMPRTVRAAVTVVLALLLTPLAPRVTLPDQLLELPMPLALELVLGIGIGLAAAVLVQGASLAGEVISLQMGLSLGPALASVPELEVPSVGQLQSLLALFIYVAVGGHLVLLRGLAESLHTLPPASALDLAGGADLAARLGGALFTSALGAAAPVMVTLLLVNVALAILARAVPQLNAMMVSLPLTIGVGLLMLGLALPLLAAAVAGWMHGLPAGVAGVTAAFRPRP